MQNETQKQTHRHIGVLVLLSLMLVQLLKLCQLLGVHIQKLFAFSLEVSLKLLLLSQHGLVFHACSGGQ